MRCTRYEAGWCQSNTLELAFRTVISRVVDTWTWRTDNLSVSCPRRSYRHVPSDHFWTYWIEIFNQIEPTPCVYKYIYTYKNYRERGSMKWQPVAAVITSRFKSNRSLWHSRFKVSHSFKFLESLKVFKKTCWGFSSDRGSAVTRTINASAIHRREAYGGEGFQHCQASY